MGAAEKAACDFFVESLEPSTACDALSFAASFAECGAHAHELKERCVGYAVDHFVECSDDSSFLELPCESVAGLIGSDDLDVKEEAVVAAVRAWFERDTDGRQTALKSLVPLIRWPLLPVAMQLQLMREKLLVQLMMLQDEECCALGLRLLTECLPAFAKSDAAADCPRLERRKGSVLPVLPLAFTAFRQQCYAASEGGALLTSTASAQHRTAFCGEVMNSWQSCAEVAVVQAGPEILIGVAWSTLDVDKTYAWETARFWGMGNIDGRVCHNSSAHNWQGQQGYATGDVLLLLLDSDAGTLTVIKNNGTLLGVAVTEGLTGDLCWAVFSIDEGGSLRIKALDPAEF